MTNEDRIRKCIEEYIYTYYDKPISIIDTASLEFYNLDSLDLANLELELAEEFNQHKDIHISIPPSSTVKEMIDHITEQL